MIYPDALCVWGHRPIVEIYASIALLSASIYDTITGEPGDLKQTSKVIAEAMKAGFDQIMADDMIDDPRLVHLPFREITADPVGVVRDLYSRMDEEVTPEFETRMKAWLDAPENQVDRYGRHPYSYEALGLDPGLGRRAVRRLQPAFRTGLTVCASGPGSRARFSQGSRNFQSVLGALVALLSRGAVLGIAVEHAAHFGDGLAPLLCIVVICRQAAVSDW